MTCFYIWWQKLLLSRLHRKKRVHENHGNSKSSASSASEACNFLNLYFKHSGKFEFSCILYPCLHYNKNISPPSPIKNWWAKLIHLTHGKGPHIPRGTGVVALLPYLCLQGFLNEGTTSLPVSPLLLEPPVAPFPVNWLLCELQIMINQ